MGANSRLGAYSNKYGKLGNGALHHPDREDIVSYYNTQCPECRSVLSGFTTQLRDASSGTQMCHM